MDEEEKVRRVMASTTPSACETGKSREAIADEFAKRIRTLDEIQADEETRKTPLRELMETLNGRKK